MGSDSPAEVVGRRIGAGLIDLLVVIVLLVVVGLLFGQTYSGHGHAGVFLHGVSAVIWAILALAYYFSAELLTGQTLGKKLLGIQVISRKGGKVAALAVGVRTVLRIIDFLPFLYLIGLLSILFSGGRAQRLGDMAAGTTVVAVPVARQQPVASP
jgi:uncharacterized RDD family membrane protein YckC